MSVTVTNEPSDRTVLYLTPIRSSQQARINKAKQNLRGKKFRQRSDTPKFCKKHGMAFLHFQQGKLTKAELVRIPCNSWTCPACAVIKAIKAKYLIKEVAILNNLLYFLTLTLDPSLIPPEFLPEGDNLTHKYITHKFNVLLTNLRRKYKHIKYVWVVEFQKNGNAHLHILLDQRIDIDLVRTIWTRIGGGHIMRIEKVQSLTGIANYLSNYIVKSINDNNANHSLHYFERRYSISQSCIRPQKSLEPLITNQSSLDVSRILSKLGLHEVYNRLQHGTFADGEVIEFDQPV